MTTNTHQKLFAGLLFKVMTSWKESFESPRYSVILAVSENTSILHISHFAIYLWLYPLTFVDNARLEINQLIWLLDNLFK